MQKFQFLLLTYWLDSPVFLKEVARDVVRTVSLCGNLQNIFFLMHSPTWHLRHFTNTFCVTPLVLHTWHLSCVSDGIGQCLLLQTSSLVTCDSMLGGLPNGLGTLHSCPACASIFLTRVYRKSLCDIFLPPHEEWSVVAVWLSFRLPLFVGQLPWARGCCPCEYLGECLNCKP